MHPSGLTLERWNYPFKTADERALVRIWLNHGLDDNITEF
jgi:hypothetical protein